MVFVTVLCFPKAPLYAEAEPNVIQTFFASKQSNLLFYVFEHLPENIYVYLYGVLNGVCVFITFSSAQQFSKKNYFC
jgi:hypothetical protein